MPWHGVIRAGLAVLSAGVVVLSGATPASAFTLKLVFEDGRPMTFGAACATAGCLERDAGVEVTDAGGEIVLDAAAGATIEYRRDGVGLAAPAPGHLSGTLQAAGDRATVVVPRLLTPAAPEVDADESDVVARLNAVRAAAGLPLARINTRLAAAADLQAAWLTQSGVAYDAPASFHVGPFGSTIGFRLGEASFPDAAGGGEIVAGGMGAAEAVSRWMASESHRDAVLAPGGLLVGPGRVGGFLVVATHEPCSGCEQAGPGVVAATGVAPASTAGAGARPLPACGREQLRVRRVTGSDRGALRLRVQASCLRPGVAYALVIREGRVGRVLARRKIRASGTIVVRVRPSEKARVLRVRLKRDRRWILSRSLALARR